MKLRIGLLTVSDRSAQGERADKSGPALAEACQGHGWLVLRQAVVPDVLAEIQQVLVAWSDQEDLDVIFTTGGTGFSPRDVTPEATREVVERQAPGLAEAMRAQSLLITPHAMLSRAIAGIRASTLIVNLPGSPKGALENLEIIAPVLAHAVQLLRSDPRAEAGHQSRRA